jgi:threonine/homoserine/homoserine lactone efflux protein
MPPLELLLPFFVASAVFACIPGPGMFYTAAQTIAHGRRAGWLSAIGFHLGGFVHITAAAFGMAILLQTVSVLHVIVKLLGATYLIWLGIKYFGALGSAVSTDFAVRQKPNCKALRDGIVVEVPESKDRVVLSGISAAVPRYLCFSSGLGTDLCSRRDCERHVHDYRCSLHRTFRRDDKMACDITSR